MPVPVVLFRPELASESEHPICREYLPTVEYRSQVPPESLVIGRYSVLPHYRELERELALNGSRLVNTAAQHEWIADVTAWAGPGGALEGLTPRTWTAWDHLGRDFPDRSFVVKGRTNSIKGHWNTHMFAQSAADVPTVARRLLDDTFIREQGLVVREYVPLKTFGVGLNGIPITNEWRTFWLADNEQCPCGRPSSACDGPHCRPDSSEQPPRANPPVCLGTGFYWQAAHPETAERAHFPGEAMGFAARAARLVSAHATFFVLDVAETASGDWIVVEVNDGQMSGLCGVSAETLYRGLQAAQATLAAPAGSVPVGRPPEREIAHALKNGRSFCGLSLTDWPVNGHRWIYYQDKARLPRVNCPTCRVPVDMRQRRNTIVDRQISTNLPPDRFDARELHQLDAVCKAVFDE